MTTVKHAYIASMFDRIAAMRRDPLVANSMFISLSSASMGALGFLYWIIAAHFYPAAQVGVASTLVSASVLIGYVGLLGFDVAFVRLLPSSAERDDEISTGLILVFVFSLVLAVAYVAVVPSVVHQLTFLRTDPVEAAAVALYFAFGAVNLVTDSVFISARSAFYNFLVDGILQGSVRLALPVALTGLGAFGLFSSFGMASLAAVAASVILMMWRFSYRPQLRVSIVTLRRVYRFAAASYVAELFTMVPVLVMPLVVISELGSVMAGYFYLALSVANLIYAVGLAVGQSLLAEGSNESRGLAELGRRAARLQVAVLVPTVVLIAASHLVLSAFGKGYASSGATPLIVLLAAAPFVGLKNWGVALLRLRNQLASVTWANGAVAVMVTVFAVATAHRGLVWVAFSWLIANLTGCVWVVTALVAGRSKHVSVGSGSVAGSPGDGSSPLG
jgi:O-antigen/teichoic acid export membrane protein